jgi:17beta-estradiol 17-dehydrogenase / very-long-chain 3-oxoacyl-CoA reductase
MMLDYRFEIVLKVVGALTIIIGLWRILLGMYRRLVRQPKKPESYGKWAIVTGSTSGIGKEYADYLAKRGMSILLISRTKDKLIEQSNELKAYNVEVRYLAYDFTETGAVRDKFYADLDKMLAQLDKEGGVGLLINNVGTTNQFPQSLLEISDELCNGMINCNMHSTVL